MFLLESKSKDELIRSVIRMLEGSHRHVIVNVTLMSRLVLRTLNERTDGVTEQGNKKQLNNIAFLFTVTVINWLIKRLYFAFGNKEYMVRDYSECLIYLLDWIGAHHGKCHVVAICKRQSRGKSAAAISILKAISIIYPDRVYHCYK